VAALQKKAKMIHLDKIMFSLQVRYAGFENAFQAPPPSTPISGGVNVYIMGGK
jgi:hypothetical protein